MSIVVGVELADKQRASLGVRHALLVCASPRRLFGRVEDTGAYGWTLATLIALVMLIGYTEVKTGLIDRSMDQRTEEALAALEKSQAHMVDRIELRERMDDARKAGEFNKLLARLGGIVFAPAHLLASLLLIAAVLYAVVALTGRKPEYHTLMSICVYSGFITLIAHIVRLAMVICYRTTEVNTSLEMLAAPGKPSALAAVDPFRIWFWVLVVIGLIVTRQLSRRMAIVSCTLMALTAAGLR
ncbi:MAG: YIP1 family protein, partial [Planctomycetota bacterium]